MRDRKEQNRVRKQLRLEQCSWANRRVLTESEARLWSALSVATGVTGSQHHRDHRDPGSQPVARRRTNPCGPRAKACVSARESGSSRNRAVVPSRPGLA
jgi:hypothetical protein